jgi:hypothetical protein
MYTLIATIGPDSNRGDSEQVVFGSSMSCADLAAAAKLFFPGLTLAAQRDLRHGVECYRDLVIDGATRHVAFSFIDTYSETEPLAGPVDLTAIEPPDAPFHLEPDGPDADTDGDVELDMMERDARARREGWADYAHMHRVFQQQMAALPF